MRNGEQTNGALTMRKRRSKNTVSSGSVKRGGRKSGNSGSTMTVTLTVGTLAPVNGEATFGLSMNVVKGAGLVTNGLRVSTTASKAFTNDATNRWKERR